MADEYEVGYGKPPKRSRFRKGKSGNPKGRPKTHRNFKTDFVTALKSPVRVTEDGKARTISTQEAIIARAREKALKGTERGLDRIIALALELGETAQDSAPTLAIEDQEILKRYGDRLLKGQKTKRRSTKPTDRKPKDDPK